MITTFTVLMGVSKHPKVAKLHPIGLSALCLCMLLFARALPADEAGAVTENAHIQSLLSEAERALTVNRLTTPPHDNAVAYIEQVLAQVPTEPRALALLNQVVDRYAELAKDAVDRSDQAKSMSLERALTFRKRAAGVISEHGLEDDALEQIDNYVATLGHPPADSRPILQKLVASHVALSEQFLERNDIAEASWHADRADSLLKRYSLKDERLPQLRRRLASVEPAAPETTLPSPTSTYPDRETRGKLTELAAFYLAAGLAEREQGNIQAAQRGEDAARDLIMQYDLSNDLVQRLSATMLVRATMRVEQPLFKVYGTF